MAALAVAVAGAGTGRRAHQLLFVEEAVHIVGGARMKGVLLLLEARPVGQHVVAFRLLPQVVELNQFADGPRPHLIDRIHLVYPFVCQNSCTRHLVDTPCLCGFLR